MSDDDEFDVDELFHLIPPANATAGYRALALTFNAPTSEERQQLLNAANERLKLVQQVHAELGKRGLP
jgi:hypothetical protein